MCVHFAPSTAKSKLPNELHPSTNDTKFTFSAEPATKKREIAQLLNRYSSTISRELARNKGLRSYRPAQQLSEERSANSRNVRRIAPNVWEAAKVEFILQHSLEQVSAHLPLSHETLPAHLC